MRERQWWVAWAIMPPNAEAIAQGNAIANAHVLFNWILVTKSSRHQSSQPAFTAFQDTNMQLAQDSLTFQTTPVVGSLIDELPTRRGFTALLSAFRATGGTARGDDVARLLKDHGVGDFIGLAKLIAKGDVFGFAWRQELWIPMFQFELRDLSVKPATQQVLAALRRGLDGWTRAMWLARPNRCAGTPSHGSARNRAAFARCGSAQTMR